MRLGDYQAEFAKHQFEAFGFFTSFEIVDGPASFRAAIVTGGLSAVLLTAFGDCRVSPDIPYCFMALEEFFESLRYFCRGNRFSVC